MILSSLFEFWFSSFPVHCFLVSILATHFQTCSSQGVISTQRAWKVSVRLKNNSSSPQGIVELSTDSGIWVYIQPSRQGFQEGNVICRQLGFGPISSASLIHVPANGTIYAVTCDGREKSLSKCVIEANVTRFHPDSSQVLNVECLPTSAKELDVYLIKQLDSLNEGVVFTFVNGQWGPICLSNSERTSMVCRTICEQLDFSRCNIQHNAVETFGREIFSDPVISNVRCDGWSQSLRDCSFEYVEQCRNQQNGFLYVSCDNWPSYNDVLSYYDHSDYMYHPRNPGGPSETSWRTIVYMVVVLVVAVCGITLYICRRNSSGMPRVLLDRSSSAHHSGETSSDGTPRCEPYSECPLDTQYQFGLQEYTPAPDYEVTDPDRQVTTSIIYPSGRDPELPTYEEAIALGKNQV